MKINFNYIFSAIFLFALTACNEDQVFDDWLESNPNTTTEVTGTSGTADLSNLVVLGTSYAAGFQDGALYDDGQAASFSALLAGQLQISGIGGTTEFGQPDINSANGYNMLYNDMTSGRSVLDLSDQAPVPTTGELASILTPWSGTTSTLNNFGVPLAQSGQLVVAATGGPVTQSYGGAVPDAGNPAYNPFYRRFASSPSADGSTGSTPLTDALSAGGTFFIYEAGLNDVVLYAAGGASGAIGPLNDAGTYESAADAAIHALATAGGTSPYGIEGAVLNVPPILVFPFFQAVKWNAVPLDEATAETLNSSFAAVNGAIDGAAAAGYTGPTETRKVTYAAGSNPILVVDTDLEDLGPYWDALVGADQMTPTQRAQLEPYRYSRPLVAGELVPLTTAQVLGTEADGDDTVADTPLGVAIPLGFDLGAYDLEPLAGDPYYLTLAEQGEIETARGGYNAALAGAVSDVNGAGGEVVLVDIESIFIDAAGLDGTLGLTSQGLNLSPDFAPNGIFSSDGIHPCDRGQGLITNKIISAINAEWGASIPEVGISSLLGPRFQP